MRFSVKIVTLFIITILFIPNTFAQQIPLDKKDVPPYIEEIGTKGMEHIFSNVEEIVQTKDDNIWLATNQGLCNYNGIDFTVYSEISHPEQFLYHSLNSLLEDDDSTLWIGSRNGLIMMKNNVFSRYGDSLLSGSIIIRMCKDDKGNIYLGTLRRGLFRINPDKSLYKYEEPALENDAIFSLFYADSTLWIGTSLQGVIRLKNEKFEYLRNISPHFSYEMRAIHKDRNGNYWFGSLKNGLIKYSNGKVQHYTLQDGLSSERIYAIAESADGGLFFGSFGGGLIKLERGQFTSYDMSNGLSVNAVRSLLYDKEGNLWIGLLGGGLNVLRQKNLLTYNMRQNLSDSYLYTVNKDLLGNIWIGTNAGGINVVTKNKLRYLNETFHPNCTNIRTITNDSKGRTWIGTINHGIVLVDKDKKIILSKATGFVNDTIESVYEDSKGTIWIGSYGPLTTYKNGKIELAKLPDDQKLFRIRFIKEDFEHNYWFATRNDGIFKYSKNKITNYSTKDGLPTNRMYSFFIHEDSSVLVCTGQGLYRYKNENFSHINFGNAFNTSNFNEILEDDFGNYWASSIIGIIAFKKEDLNKFINGETDVIPNRIIGKEDGMLTPECNGGNQNAGAKSLDGRLWFPTPNGVVVIDPEKTLKEINNTSPNIFINRLIVNDSLININNGKIEIPSDPRNIQIFYSALSYKNPLLNKYKYRLIGLGSDNEWIEAGNMNMVRYSTLPYGKYIFEVIGSNSDLVWNTIGARLTFTVLPKFYQKTSFIILASLCMLLLLYLIYKFRIMSLERNKIRLQTIVAEQTAALQYEIEQRKQNEEKLLKMRKIESLSLLAGGIAHDFNNLLTAILGNISLLKYKIEQNDTNNITKLIENTETASMRARGLTQQLLTFSKEGKPLIKSVSIGKLVEECTTFTLRGSSTKSYFDIANDLWIVDVDEGQINQVIQNLVVNANQAMPNGGNIYVTAKNVTIDSNNPITTKTKFGNYVQISVRDTGVGISEENIRKVFDPYFTTKKTGHGIGLASCFTIMKNHKGHIDVKSELGVGTEFSIFLPRSKNCSPKNPSVDTVTITEKKEIATGKGKILIMDDEISILNVLQEFLTNLGYEICVFKDSESALKTFKSDLEKTPFDLAILDFTIPGGMGGIELNKHLLELDPNLKSILSTGHIDNQTVFDFKKYMFCDIIIKPYKIEDISKVVQKALSSKLVGSG